MKRHSNGVAIVLSWSPKARSRAPSSASEAKVVGLDHLALDDAEIELDLVEPGGVDRGVDDPDRRPALAEVFGS